MYGKLEKYARDEKRKIWSDPSPIAPWNYRKGERKVVAQIEEDRIEEEFVIICNSESAYTYHSYRCGGLSRCRSKVLRIKLGKAKKWGYKPCKMCF